MAYTAVPTYATLDTFTAENANQYWRDNFAAGVPDIFTAAGDTAYATAADAAAALAIGTAGQVLTVNAGATAPEWKTPVTGITLEQVFPVGSVYINASVNTNPATLLGFGTWVALGTGRVMVGQNTGDADFATLLGEVGAKTISSGTSGSGGTGATGGSGTLTTASEEIHGEVNHYTPESATIKGHTHTLATHTHTGPSHTHSTPSHSIVQPVVVVKMWYRSA